MRTEDDEVYAALWPRLVRTAYAVSGDLGVAEDAVPDGVREGLSKLAPDLADGGARGLLRRMAVNEVLNDRRLARRRHEITSEEPPERAGAGSPDDRARPREMWRRCSSLPPRQRAVLVLRYYEDLSEQQIAEVLGCVRAP